MNAEQHNQILAGGFAAFSAIIFFTFGLLLLVTTGVFVALGISFAHETGDNTQAGIGILGGVLTVVFYVILGLIFVLPTALASWKMLKRRKRARVWGIVAAILLLPILPLGTMLGGYGLWFLFSAEGKRFYLNLKP